MKRSSTNDRMERLAAALKENLKRRKAQARIKASGADQARAHYPGTAAQAGFENMPSSGPKTAPKRI